MLLNQTSGIDDYVKVLFASPDAIAATATTTYAPRELVRIALGLPPLGVPGTRWSYANTNYVILGLLIERVTGRPYAAEVTRRVLRPLRLTDTYFPGAERTVRGAHMKAYVPWVDGTLRDFSVFDMSWAGAAGELVSTTPDVNRFFRALLGGRLLRPELLREMKTTVPFDPAVAHLGGYGLGLYWLATPCGRSWGHNGLVIGQTTYSTHAEDGDAAQLTIAENLNSYQDLANPAPHPIDLARAQLQLEVSCGGAPAAPGAASATRGLAAASALATHRQGRVRG
jgi:D-alanyl-D-alanine carboxypeptidase